MNFSLEGILKELKSKDFYNIEIIRSTTSTNDVLKSVAKQGELEGKVLVALSQSNGKGRLGRNFFSQETTGLYFSVILRPILLPKDSILITTAAATAVAKAIKEVSGKNAKIKWVNDVFVGSKKVCGILTEAGIKNEKYLDYAVLGIGINAFYPENGFKNEIKDIAGAVFDNNADGMRNKLLAKILDNFYDYYKNLTKKEYVKEYISLSCAVGEEVTVISNSVEKDAFCIGIDDECRLIVKYPSGEKGVLSSGEISIKIKSV